MFIYQNILYLKNIWTLISIHYGIHLRHLNRTENEEFEFSGGFTDLHTVSYQNILEGTGFRISEAQKAIQIVHEIRNKKPLGLVGDYHPMAELDLSKHPFLK